jgi:K+-transporting ATPase ATPase B chain
MADPRKGFLDRTIALVEGAQRSKTPNQIALTLVFLIVVSTIRPIGT